jgi:hypothetical protein
LFFHRAPPVVTSVLEAEEVAVAVVSSFALAGIAAPRTDEARTRATVKRAKEVNMIIIMK